MTTLHLPTELKKIEDWIVEEMCGIDDYNYGVEAFRKELHTALLTLVKRVGEEVRGMKKEAKDYDNNHYINNGGKFSSYNTMLAASQYNSALEDVRSHLDEMLQTLDK